MFKSEESKTMKIMRFEMSRAFRNVWFAAAVAMGTAMGIADFFLGLKRFRNVGINSLIQTWLGTNYQFVYNCLFYVLLPLIACLPYAGTCFTDVKSGYDRNICVRTSRLSYMVAKAMAVAASGAVAVAVPLLVDLFICAGVYPDKLPDRLSFLYAGITDIGMFPRLFALHPVWYSLVYIGLDAVFGALLGLTAMCVARWSGSRFSTIMGPFALYVFTSVIFEGDGIGTWSAMYMVNPLQIVVVYSYQMVLMYVGVCLVSLLLIYIWHRRRDIL